jgi:hypothetical protein
MTMRCVDCGPIIPCEKHRANPARLAEFKEHVFGVLNEMERAGLVAKLPEIGEPISLDTLAQIRADVMALDGVDTRPVVAFMSPGWYERLKPMIDHLSARNRAGHRPAWKRVRRLARLGL